MGKRSDKVTTYVENAAGFAQPILTANARKFAQSVIPISGIMRNGSAMQSAKLPVTKGWQLLLNGWRKENHETGNT
jgi:hypothetical protein